MVNLVCAFAGPLSFLLLARKEDIRRISLDTRDLPAVVVPVNATKHAVAIDFDPVDKFVYWSDDGRLEIKRSRLDGTGNNIYYKEPGKGRGGEGSPP